MASFNEDISSSPDTPRIINDKLLQKGRILSTNNEAIIEPLSKPGVPEWRPKTMPTNKLRLNMKRILNTKFKNEKITTIEYYSTEGEIEDNTKEIIKMKWNLGKEIVKVMKNKVFQTLNSGQPQELFT